MLGVQYVGLIAALLGIAAIKRRIVFPRGGYVAPLARGRTTRLLFFSVFVLVAVICLCGGWQQNNAGMTSFGIYLACLAPLLWWLPVTDYERSACLQIA